jgi:hypothetical protein
MIWQGQTVAVCGSGPSLTEDVAAAVRALGVPVIVTNDTWRRLPDADVLFAANASWWNKRNPRVSPLPEEFAGERIVCEQGLVKDATFVAPRKVRIGGNSALRACHLAEDRGAARILLFGVDLRDDDLTHWHGLHRGLDNPNWTTFKRHRTAWDEYAMQIHRPEIVNCNPRSALDCFPKQAPAIVRVVPASRQVAPPRPAVVLQGMHGLGDAIHERAIVRELKKAHEVWVMTSWPQLLHDLPDLHLLPLSSPIPWMAANERRCSDLYGSLQPPAGARVVRCAYAWPDAKKTSVLAAMAKHCGVAVGDFRLPIAAAWNEKADVLLERLRPRKPLLMTRPLLALADMRNPRSAVAKLGRNPNPDSYGALFADLRGRYFVISIADAMTGHEELLEPRLAADVEFHAGELDIETVAALTARAALVYCSPCFLTVLAQAVEAPLVCVFGGFEGPNSFAAGARYSRWLPITPRNPCACWNWNCRHDKTIDVAAARTAIESFIGNRNDRTADAEHAQEPAEVARAREAA